MYDASGTVTTGGTAQIILPEQFNRTSFFIQNISSGNLFVEFGGARATCTLTSNKVASFTVSNGGFGYTIPPIVKFYGGGDLTKNPTYLCPGLPGNVMPGYLPKAHAVLSTGAVSSIVLDDPGAAYFVKAPMVFLQSSDQDPWGVASPSATDGLLLTPNGGNVYFNGTATTTDAIAIFGATTGQAFTVKYTIGG
jgi:hypothetical protein